MADEPQRFCLGIAYMPGPDPRIAKGADGGRDFLTEAELEKAAWSFLRSGPQVNAFHIAGTEGCATVVESSIHRGPDWDLGDGIVVTKGTWLVGAILEDRMWQAALDGKVNGWSPEGTARRRKVRKEEGAVTIAKSALPDGDDEEFSELLGCDFPKMGLVGKGANGIPRFLVMKGADGTASGLLDPAYVRELIGKQAAPEPTEEVVTMTGSPAAIAAMIHKAARRQADPGDVAKAKNDTADRKHKAATGAAMSDGSYPVASVADLDKAIRAVGRGGSSHDAIRRHIIARARSLSASSKIPDNWAADGSLKEGSVSKSETVTKTDMGPELDDGVDGMDPTVPLAAPETEPPGDPTVPGSPAWEAIDAATAQKWCSILARARVAVDLLAERELLEAASADPDDAEHAWDLQDVCCAIDYAISVLAPFAVAEQSEADCGEAELAAIGKAAADLPEPVFVLESLGSVVAKSGRVLSAVNEAHIREAAARLNTVLASLPRAPVTDDGQQVAKSKEDGMAVSMNVGGVTVDAAEPVAKAAGDAPPSAEEQARDAGPADAGGTTGMGDPRHSGPLASLPGDGPQVALPGDAPGRQVIKAGGEKTPMCVVYDQKGRLMGIVAPDDITPVANAEAGPEDAAGESDGEPPAADGDMTPAPPAEAGTPADAVQPDGTVTKSTDDTDVSGVLKSIIADAVAAALGGQAPAEDIAKQADVAGLLQEVETLKARLATVEEHPAAPAVFTHGATPPPGSVPPARPSLRGQDQGAPPVDIAKAAEMKQQLYTADPAERIRISDEMQQAAISQLAAIHARR